MYKAGKSDRPRGILKMEGSGEVGIDLYGADACAEIVSSGSTAMANGIQMDFSLMEYPGAVLVGTQRILGKLYGYT